VASAAKDFYATAIRGEKASGQTKGRGFAGTGSANDTHGFAAADLETGALQNRLATKRFVDIPELNQNLLIVFV